MKLIAPPRWFVGAALTLAASDFAAFHAIASKLGGLASYGYESGPRYFLSFGKGTFVEVSRLTFQYSWWHENIAYGLVVFAVLMMAWRYWGTGSLLGFKL
jgi:hypothetical protein